MDNDTLHTLHKEVIQHWEHNLELAKTGNWDEIYINSSACAFCLVFLYTEDPIACKNCPIFVETKQPSCRGTPYHKVANSLSRYRADADLVAAIEEELEFLRNLKIEETL